MKWLSSIFLVVLLTASPALGQLPSDLSRPGGRMLTGESLVPVRVAADRETVHPGETFHLAVFFTIEPGWHIYWINAGAAGLATSIDVTGPSGFAIGDVQFPRPTAHHEPEGITFGYDRKTVLFVPVTAPAQLGDGTADFELDIGWLVCKKTCLLGSAKRRISLETSSVAATGASQGEKLIEEYRRRLPQPWKKLAGADMSFDNGQLTLTGPAQTFDSVEFFPIEAPGVTYGKARTSVADGRFEVTVPVEVKPNNAQGKPMAIKGVIGLGNRSNDPSFSFDMPVDG